MNIHQDDPFPGRCRNLRPYGLEMLRCVEYEREQHVCSFPPPKYPLGKDNTYSHNLINHTVKPEPWKRPEKEHTS